VSIKTLFLPGVMLLVASMATMLEAAPKPPNIKQCKSKWVLTTTQPMVFGSFAIEAGSGSLSMDSNAALTTAGLISLSTAIPVTTFVVNVDNTKSAICATHGFDLSWSVLPAPLTGPGSAIPLTNVRVTIPAYSLNNVSLPQTIAANPGNTIPFTMTIHGSIAVVSPQSAGAYLSPTFTVDLTQEGTAKSASSTAGATSLVPLSIVETVPMDFGTVAGGPIAGTVILDTFGSRSLTGDVQSLITGPGNAASFQVSGEPSQVYSLTYGNGTLANAGGQQLSLSAFTDNSLGTLPGAGVETFQVGATLSIGSNQPAGLYSTSNGGGSPYTITINYN
jgi:hypothetical protein